MTEEVLLADDDALTRELIRSWLEREGYNVETVPDGKQALKSFDRRRFDIIILDWMMPRMNGFNALMAMRQKEMSNHVPGPARIFIITSKREESYRFRSHLGKANGFIYKPLKKEVLLRMIEEN